MSIRDDLLRNRRVYGRLFGQRGRQEEADGIRLPEREENALGNFPPAPEPQAFSLSPNFPQETAGAAPPTGFSLGAPAERDPEEAAQPLLQALEREGRFRSQDLWGEEA